MWDYLNFYQQNVQIRTTLLQRRGRVTAGHSEPVAITWALAFARVQEVNSTAADLLRACAFLDPDRIPEDLLRQGASSWAASLGKVAGNLFQWNEMIGVLLKYALVGRSREYQEISIHRLAQTTLRDAMDEQTHRLWVESTIKAVEHVFPDGRDSATWSTCNRFLSHAQACFVLIERYTRSSQEAAKLLLRTADYLHKQARYSEAEPLYQRSLWIWEESLGAGHIQVTYPLYGLVNSYKRQGKYCD